MPVSLLRTLALLQKENRKIAVVSLHDASSARIACNAGADVLLVGDSAGNTLLGYDDTLSVSFDEMRMLTAAVARGAKKSSRPDVPVIADLPFASSATVRDAVKNGAALMRAGAHAVKLEGAGKRARRAIEALIETGMPVVGHLGFTPQSALTFQNIVQGRDVERASRLLQDARALQEFGCCAIVLEAVAAEAAREISLDLTIPTIGIGAGVECDGQVLVWHDLVGLSEGTPYRFVRRFAESGDVARGAVEGFVRDVQNQSFPSPEHGWKMNDGEATRLAQWREESASDSGKKLA
ncbi:MAG TPA: 3-methyl-2-oxobutanoate hydroxymethyltransferase [Abditibacteriaceae bacterium]|jgi:3-methyl-2-oxobutanoate hydroxymethyltransferase